MSYANGPKIVTDGLVLALDIGNTKSYISGSTTCNDLSGNRNNGTLINNPNFTGSNGGGIVFDGTDDYIEVTTRNTNLEFQPTQAYSVFCWVYNLTNGSGTIVANMVGTAPYPGWDLWRNGDGAIAAHLISFWTGEAVKVKVNFDFTANANKWVNIGYTYNGSSPINSTDSLNSMNFYVNGQLTDAGKMNDGTDGFNTTSQVITYDTSQRFRIASRWASGAFLQGSALTTSNVSVYKRALSAQEILQNYNAMKRRFGL